MSSYITSTPQERIETSHRIDRKVFYLFILIHILFWSLVPCFLRSTLTHDTLEGLVWGMQWQWGYNKHPILAAYLAAGFTAIFGHLGSIYLLAQLAVAATFLAVWQLSRCFFSEAQALVATLSLEGVLFYNLNSFNFTPDTLQSPLWAWLAYFLYRALTTQRARYWLFVGVFSALAMLTKYQALILFVPMFLLLLTSKKGRQSFTNLGFYCGWMLALLLLLPHFLWLVHHDWISLVYAFNTPKAYTPIRPAYAPLVFSWRYCSESLGYAVGVLVLFWPFYHQPKTHALVNQVVKNLAMDKETHLFNRQFLIFLGMGPFLLSLMLCVLVAGHFPARWSTPYFFLVGALMVCWLNPTLSRDQLRQFLLTIAVFTVLLGGGLMAVLVFPSTLNHEERSDAFYPNQRMALFVERLWHEQYPNKPLHYLAGAHYLVAAMASYLPKHPVPYFNFSQEESPWVNEADFRKQGGIVLIDQDGNYNWDQTGGKGRIISEAILSRFPQIQWLGSFTFKRKGSAASPIIISVALLPPHDMKKLS